MRGKFQHIKLLNRAAVASAIIGAFVVGASDSRADDSEKSAATESTKKDETNDSDTGSQLWSYNCGRCHNKISPDAFGDRGWATVMQHMRSRANITGDDAQKILEFLKSANDE